MEGEGEGRFLVGVEVVLEAGGCQYGVIQVYIGWERENEPERGIGIREEVEWEEKWISMEEDSLFGVVLAGAVLGVGEVDARLDRAILTVTRKLL